MKDFYIRNDEDFKNYQNDIYELSDELSLLLTQIEVLLFTRKKEIIGHHNCGLNLEDLIFGLNANESNIKSEINTQIALYCPTSRIYSVECRVSFFRGEVKDVAIVDIFVDGSKGLTILL